MSMSLRDQLLQAGLVSQKQVKDAQRQQDRQARHLPKHKPGIADGQPPRHGQAAKIARDQDLNRQQQGKAHKKALLAQIRQLIEQNRLPQVEGDDFYNFVDGNKIRRIAVSAAVRASLSRGEIVIVRHDGRHHLVAADIAARIRERDKDAVIASITQEGSPTDNATQGFSVPDDLIW